MSKEILDRLTAVEVAQNGLTNRLSLVEQQQEHMIETFGIRFDGFAAQLRLLDTTMLNWDTKLEKMIGIITVSTTDNMASAAGRQIVSDISQLKVELKSDIAELKAEAFSLRAIVTKNTARIDSTFAVVGAVKWVGFPALALMVIGGIVLFGKVNHLW